MRRSKKNRYRAENRSRYTYAPLQHTDSIRLLTLYPGDFSSPLQISLAEVRSQEGHAYECLSYTWATEDGDCRRSSQVKCDSARIRVTKNCELALRYLRRESTERVLWVDAICINQNDDKERGHQVGIMRDIYSGATEVLIWLGEASKDVGIQTPVEHSSLTSTLKHASSSQASDPGLGYEQSNEGINNCDQLNFQQPPTSVSNIFLDHIHRMAAETRRLEKAGQDPKSSPLYQGLVSQISQTSFRGANTDLRRGFEDIVQRRWWSRIWVVQEVAVAQSATFICSKQSTSYTAFLDWYEILRTDYSPEGRWVYSDLYLALDHLRIVFRVKNGKISTGLHWDVFWCARTLTSSNPRDKIFGLLGISDELKSLLPPPDYSKTATEIFTDIAKVDLEQTKSLWILEEAGSIKDNPDHPSWVPYWSTPRVIDIWLGNPPEKASRSFEAIFEVSSDDRELRVKGKYFDKVNEIPLGSTQVYGPVASLKNRLEGLRKSCELGFTLSEYPTGEAVEEALWRTLCYNRDLNGPRPSNKTGDAFREWYHIITSTSTWDDYRNEILARQNSFESLLDPSSPLCTTANGYIAQVPYTTEIGDCITVLAGGAYPFVLRPTDDHYRLIGPCYVHGIMDGKAFPENVEELEWFSIR